MSSIKEIITTLEDIFDKANAKFYDGKVIRPVITVQTASRGVLGWCSCNRIWNNEETNEEAYEINIVAEHLTRSINEVVGTMLHEMVHLHNLQNGIKDCTAVQYHNKHFRDSALEHGLKLMVEKADVNKGYSYTELNDEGLAFVKEMGWEDFKINRTAKVDKTPTTKVDKTPKKTHKTYTFVCDCGTKIRHKDKELKITCGVCKSGFILKTKSDKTDKSIKVGE